ncbi:single-stranded DNA-binding protein [Hyphomicrobium sp. B1]|uniref:single-stranded DNA-binding protein n=1 Tax=Hyphomicrobium sp. B1 TaxID=3075651 RepID=UPI003C2EBFBF
MNGSIEVAFIGRVIERPELKTSAAGKPWCSIRLAVGDGETAQYVRVAVFGEMAERLASSIEKGAKLYVEGWLRLDRWRTSSNEERSGLSCAATKVEKIGASAIGRNKPAKPKQADHQAPPQENVSTHKHADIDAAIPF